MARFHPVARRDLQTDHHGRSARADLAGEFAGETIRVRLDFDSQPALRDVVQNAQAVAAQLEDCRVVALVAECRDRDAAVEMNPIPPGAHPKDFEPIAFGTSREVDPLARRRRNRRRRQRGWVRIEFLPGHIAEALIGENRSSNQCLDRVVVGSRSELGCAVQPLRVEVAAAILGSLEDVDQKAFIGCPSGDDQFKIRERTDEPRARLLAGLTRGDQLRNQGIELRRNRASGGYPGVKPHSRSKCGIEQNDLAGGRKKVSLGVFCTYAGFDRNPGSGLAAPR